MKNFENLLHFNTDISYFQWGGYSAKPNEVIEETIDWLRKIDSCPANPEIHEAIQALTEKTRKTLAELLNVQSEEIVITENTTVGHNIIALGIDFRENDTIVLSRHEHPANILPWYALAERKGLRVVLLDAFQDDEKLLHQLQQVLQSNCVRMVSLSHVSRNTGYRLPVRKAAELCRTYESFFLVDGAQSFGNIPVDIRSIGCDAYSFCGHKWTFGPQGTGGLWLAQESMDKVRPSLVGSKSQSTYDLDGKVVWKPDMRRYEYGTRNFALIAGWLKALELIGMAGWEKYYKIIQETTGLWKNTLSSTVPGMVITPREWERSSGIFVLEFPGKDAGAFSDWLYRKHGILCSRLENTIEKIRICNHVVNDDEERGELAEMAIKFAKGELTLG
jgi:L-cysteine/cystine lyase